jgi:hypothetical protein
MAKPLGSHTDKELEGALAEDRLTKRKAAVAEEILRRRKDAKRKATQSQAWLDGRVFCRRRFAAIQPEAPLAKAATQLAICALLMAWAQKKPGPMWDRACKFEST